MGKGGFMRVVVVDEQGRSAWSNPVWRSEGAPDMPAGG